MGIRGWAEDPSRGVGPFRAARMEEQRLDQMTLRLGYPYLYQHQGNHEHLVSFVDIRLVGPGDPQSEKDYPMLRSVGSQMPRYCDICQTCIAVWVCKDHIRVPNDPSFFFADGDDLSVGKFIGLLKGGRGSSGGHLLFEVKSNIAELLLDVTDNLTLSSGGERVATLSEDLHQVVGELTSSKVKTDDGMGEGITFIDGDTMGDTITRVHDNTSGTSRGIKRENSL